MKATLRAIPKPVLYYGLPALILEVIAVIAWKPLLVLNLQARWKEIGCLHQA